MSAAIALLCANFSMLVPDDFIAGLHATRTAAPSLDVTDLLNQLAIVDDQQATLQARYDQVLARIAATEQSAGAAQHEVAVLEAALPRLVETVPVNDVIDATALTGGINPSQHFSRSVASVAVLAAASEPLPQPMPPKLAPEPTKPEPAPAIAAPALSPQPIVPANPAPTAGVGATPPQASSAALGWASAHSATPSAPAPPNSSATEALLTGETPASKPEGSAAAVPLAPIKLAERDVAAPTANPRAIGVAVGPPVAPANAMGAWQQLASRVGVLLVGTSPLLADDPAGSTGKVLVAGPISSITLATSLCANIGRAGISCLPMPYVGTDLPPPTTP